MLDVIMTDDDLQQYAEHGAGLQLIAQRIRARALTVRGDDPNSKTNGIDWLTHLSTRPPDLDALIADLALAWSGIPGVVEVRDLTAQTGSDPSQAVVEGEVITEYGTVPVTVDSTGAAGNPSITVGGVIGQSRRIVL